MGDPKGVGPEIVAAIASDPTLNLDTHLTIFGDPNILDAAAKVMKRPSIKEWTCDIVAVSSDPQWKEWKDDMCGRMSRDYVVQAVEYCQTNGAALVTAPINKHRCQLVANTQGYGHTEFLAGLTHTNTVGMMMAGPKLRTVPVTIHTPLSEVSHALTKEKIVTQCQLTHHFLQKHFNVKSPRIAVAGLNPHAGDQGSIGQEEIQIIRPAVTTLKADGFNVSGPYAADALFAHYSQYDAIVCMFHDQALIPTKMLDYRSTVNITMGLPFIRTSPDHGTAEDIAWQGCVDTQHMTAAVKMALSLERN